jgi:hypothetical protein
MAIPTRFGVDLIAWIPVLTYCVDPPNQKRRHGNQSCKRPHPALVAAGPSN